MSYSTSAIFISGHDNDYQAHLKVLKCLGYGWSMDENTNIALPQRKS